MNSTEELAPSIQPDPLVELAARLVRRVEGLASAEAKADLLCRLGLLCWDVLGDLEAAAKYLADAGSAHPEAIHLRLHLAIQKGDQKALRELGREVSAALADREVATRFHCAVAEIWLFHFSDAEEATRAAREALRRSPADAEARGLLTLALELTSHHENLVKHLRTAPPAATDAHRRLAALLGDRLGQQDEASKIVRRLRAKAEEDPYLLERLWEMDESGEELGLLPRDTGVSLLRQKLALLGDPDATEERDAARYRLAQLLLGTEAGAEEGEALLGELSRGVGTWGPVLALHIRRTRALRRRNRAELAEIYLTLGERSAAPGFSAAYLQRSAELFEAADLPERAAAGYQRLLTSAPGNHVAIAGAERLLLEHQRHNDLIELYELAARQLPEHASTLLGRAAHIAEGRLRDAAEAARLRRPTIERRPEQETLGALARIFRGGQDRRGLLRVYQQFMGVLGEAGDKRRAALYAAAAGVVSLSIGEIGGTEKLLTEALELAPDDIFARTALLGFYRRAGRWRDLVRAIEHELGQDLPNEEKAQLHAEIGRIAIEHLKDMALADTHLDVASRLSPEDPSLCHLLAQVYDLERNFPKAIAMRRKAADGFGASFRAAVLLCEIGDIFARYLGDDQQAEAALKEALGLDDEMEAAMEALAALYRRQGRHQDLLSVCEQRIDVAREPEQQAQLHLEIADILERNLQLSDAALEHYQQAYLLTPGVGEALTGLERLSRRLNRWDVLGDTLVDRAGEPQARLLLGEALERLGRWEELRVLLVSELDTISDPEAMASMAVRIADIQEQRLSEPVEAISFVRRALDATPGDMARLERYRRLAEAYGGAAERIDACARLLALLPPDATRRVALSRRMGELLLGDPSRLDEAGQVLEEGARLAPDDEQILALLGRVYEAQGRGQELLDVLQRRAEKVTDPVEQSVALLRTATIHEERDEIEEALAALLKAFRLDPGNRETFTRAERLCYRIKRWREVMEVYEIAIEQVEKNGSRAYRLGDLFARRGQLQLQYLSQTGEAASSYLRVIELDPGNDTALKFLESIFSKEGDWAGLIAAYEKRAALVKDQAKRIETLRRAARVAAAKLKDPAEAARHYEALHALQPEDGEALDALERYFERTRNWERLVAVLETRVAQVASEQERQALHLKVATVYEEGLRNVEGAIDSYKKVLESAPSHREALEALGRIFESTERWAELIDITRRQVKVTQDRAAKALLFFKCGSVMEAKFDKSDDAIRYYEAAIKTSSSCLPAVHGLRDIYLRGEDWPRVLQTLELEVKLWQESKERAGVLARMGRIHEEHLHDLDQAVHYYEAALSVDADCMPAIRSMFDVAFKREDWEQAARLSQNLSQKALREGEPALRSDFYFKRGLVASHAGAVDQAAENFVVALEIRPENLLALDGLIELCRQHPGAYDYESTFRALEKIYQRREWPQAKARVLVARGTLLEQAGGFDAALASYREALSQVPDDYGVIRPIAALLAKLRRADEALAALEQFVGRVDAGSAAWAAAMLLAAEIQCSVLLDSRRAEATLRALLKRQAKNSEALYRLAQELVLLGRPGEARTVCQRLIEVAADPKNTASPVELGRYYYYLGHVALLEGDDKTATSSFRRSLELAPGYPPASIALAHRHFARGSAPQAEALLNNAARLALDQGRAGDTQRLRRELAVVQARAGNQAAALAELRAQVASRQGSLEDRFALVDLYAAEESHHAQAVEELETILALHPDALEAVRRLVDLCPPSAAARRARALRTAVLLGLASPHEREELGRLETAALPPGGVLTDDLRARGLAADEVRGPLGQIWQAMHEHLERLYPAPTPAVSRKLDPSVDGVDPRLIAVRLGLAPDGFEVLVSEDSRHPAWVAPGPVPTIILRESLVRGPASETTFLLARTLEHLRSHFSLLLRVGPRERQELGLLLKAMAKPAEQREPAATELLGLLARPQLKVVERVAAAAGDLIPRLDTQAWMRDVETLMSQVALVTTGDLGAAARMIARIGGLEEALRPDGRIVLRALPGGHNLLRFYLSTHYDELLGGMLAATMETA